jgi:hypothetical protein
MSNRFFVPWSRLHPMVRGIRTIYHGADGQLVSAFNAAVDHKWYVSSITQFDKNVRAVCEHTEEPAWPLLNTISALLLSSPEAARKAILDVARFETGAPFEILALDREGAWRVGWLLTDNPKTEEDIATLEWYRPDDPGRTPITPQPIIDYIAGCVALYRAGLILPALAVLTMAYESVLWDALAASGVARTAKHRTYLASNWKLKRVADKLVVQINGADEPLTQLVNVPGEVFEEIEARLTHVAADHTSKAELSIKVTTPTSKFLTSSQTESEEDIARRGLRSAVEMARGRNIWAITTVVEQLDETFIAIRNSLVHFPANGLFVPPIPVLGRAPIANVAALATDHRRFVTLLTPVLGVINTTYSEPVSPTVSTNSNPPVAPAATAATVVTQSPTS